MRQIGTIANSEQAERFADHLRAEGIACTVDKDANGFRVWVHDDDHVAGARAELPQFLTDPDHPRYQDAGRRAMARIRDDLNRQRIARKHTVNLTEKWSRPVSDRCPMTIGLIAMSIVVAYFTGLDLQREDLRIDQMWFSNDGTLKPILHGEVWRVFSPIFLHSGMPHLVFNMVATWQFGTQIESRKGTLRFLSIVLVVAAVSNYFQFQFQGPYFGGMSGVVYGLFGYIWVKGRMDPESGFDLPQQTVTMMLVWHVLCMVGVIPNVANWAHGAGLVTGVVIAAGTTMLKPLIQRK